MNTVIDAKLRKGCELIEELNKVWSSGPFSFYKGKLTDIVEEFFKRCCPVKVGDIVEITEEIDFNVSYGWAGSKHFLKVGDRAKVEAIDFDKGKFYFDVIPFNQTYEDGRVVPEPKTYCFRESMCKKVEPDGVTTTGTKVLRAQAQMWSDGVPHVPPMFFKDIPDIRRKFPSNKLIKFPYGDWEEFDK